VSTPPEISIVIPAFNEASRIPMTLGRTCEYMAGAHPEFEVLVVDDGSSDDTSAIVDDWARRDGRVRLLREATNHGKGWAVRRGMLEASGRWVLFMDADMSTPVEELDKLLFYAHQGFEVVVGSRGLPNSDIRIHQPFYREAMGKVFNRIVRLLLPCGIRDTQCGFKLFSAKAAKSLFSLQKVEGFAFDVEILMLAQKEGFKVQEVPVIWFHAPHSKVSPIRDSTAMFADILRIRARRILGRGE
jgi:dolichyl-phosphate beta-glucosyltransferase